MLTAIIFITGRNYREWILMYFRSVVSMDCFHSARPRMIGDRSKKERGGTGPASAARRNEEVGLWLAQLLIYNNTYLVRVMFRFNVFICPAQPFLLSDHLIPQGFLRISNGRNHAPVLLTHAAPPRKPYKDKIRCVCSVSCWMISVTPLHFP